MTLVQGVFGQDVELGAVETFLDEIQRGPSTLILEGEIGAGKTTLLGALVATARGRGYRVLACRPAEAEASLAFAALGDLLQDAVAEPHMLIPEPQLRALRVAVLLEDPDGPPPDQRTVSVATVALLRSMSQGSPVLMVVDDYQWLDAASQRVLQFAFRRLEEEPVGLVVVLRTNDGAEVPITPAGDHDGSRTRRLSPAAMTPDSLDAMFRMRLGDSFPPPLLRQIAEASGGNPLFATEIAHAIQRGELGSSSGQPLPVPRTLQGLVRERLAGLAGDVRELLFLAAAVSEPTVELLVRVAGGDASSMLEQAVAAGVVEVDGRHVRFVHPLFASTVFHALDPDRRRALHGRLATIVTAPDEHARQLSLAATGPSADVAAALDEAAAAAANRGAPDAAASLSEQAAALSPEGDPAAADGRRLRAAEFHFAAGDTARARVLLEELAVRMPRGPGRADVLRRLAKVRYRHDSPAVAADLLARALEEAEGDVALRAGIERDLAWAVTLCGDVAGAAGHAASALELIDDPSHPLLPELLAASTMTAFLLGGGVDRARIERAVELERPTPEVPIEWRPSMILAVMQKWAGELADARRQFGELLQRARDAGEETSLPFLLSQISETDTLAGNWTHALAAANEGHTIALQTGQEPIRAMVLYAKALAEAHLGLVDEARAAARAGLELSQKVGSVITMMLNQSVLGFLELSVDDPAAAHRQLAPLLVWRDVVGIREPGVVRFEPDELEALVALGRHADAGALLAEYAAEAERMGRPRAMVAAARCRALLCAAMGEAASGMRVLETAIGEHGPRVPAWDRARAELVLGSIQRRTRQRKAARTTLALAKDRFEELGARLWVEKVERMLGARDGASPAGTSALTPAERRVAALVASGLTNREAADRLFVGVRTVEVHLTSIYRKLGMSSRTELAAATAREGGVSPPGRTLPPRGTG